MVANRHKLEDGADDVAAYEHDGLHRRITEQVDGDADGSLDSDIRHFYYSSNWQILGRIRGSGVNAMKLSG